MLPLVVYGRLRAIVFLRFRLSTLTSFAPKFPKMLWVLKDVTSAIDAFQFDQFDWATINAFYARNFDRDLKPDFSGMPTELKEIIESALKFNPSGRGGENR